MGIHHVLAVLRARLLPLLAVIAVTVGVTVFLSLTLPPRYTATVTLVVDANRIDPTMGINLPAGIGIDYINTQLQIVQSPAVALRVVRDLKLAEDPSAEQYWREEGDGSNALIQRNFAAAERGRVLGLGIALQAVAAWER